MRYEDALREFWKVAAERSLDCKTIAVMCALLHIRQERGFPARCSVPNVWLEELLHLDIRAIRTARKRLIECGLIRYVEGKAKRQPEYIFEVGDEPMEIPIAQGWMDEQPEEVVSVPDEEKEKPKRKARPKAMVLFKEEKVKAKPKEKKVEPPTIDEVRGLFRSRGLSDDEAERFFYYYDAQGWVTSSGQKIKRIDSMVNRWLTNEKKNRNENNQGDNRESMARDAAAIVASLMSEERRDDAGIR